MALASPATAGHSPLIFATDSRHDPASKACKVPRLTFARLLATLRDSQDRGTTTASGNDGDRDCWSRRTCGAFNCRPIPGPARDRSSCGSAQPFGRRQQCCGPGRAVDPKEMTCGASGGPENASTVTRQLFDTSQRLWQSFLFFDTLHLTIHMMMLIINISVD